MEAELLDLLSIRRGHFRLESGHHGSLWLDLDALFLRPRRLEPFIHELARRLSTHRAEMIVGPLVGGAFLAQKVAAELGIQFCFSERAKSDDSAFHGVSYRVPDAFHGHLRNRKVAIVDDAINAGSATRATFAALKALGAQPVVVGALLVLGEATTPFFADNDLPLERIAFLANELWTPADCPLCASRVPLSIPSAGP